MSEPLPMMSSRPSACSGLMNAGVPMAVGTAAPVSAGLGGAVGSMAALAAAWSAPELSGSPGMMRARRVAGGVLLLLGLVIGIPNVLGIDIIGIGN